MKIVILGAGPTGIGAAYRLEELGHKDYVILEKNSVAGGLSRSSVDKQGFTWDIGGHVQFSHYKYFDSVMDSAIKNWIYHNRESWVWIMNHFIPYPFQNNIHRLPREVAIECLNGIIDCYINNKPGMPSNFQEWINKNLGSGIAKYFMNPYNFKVWAYPSSEMNSKWVGERAALVDLKRILKNLLEDKDDVNWGPNNQFRFPEEGGTGQIWYNLAQNLNIEYNHQITGIHSNSKILSFYFNYGYKEINYDWLINTIPIDTFINNSDLELRNLCKSQTDKLKHSAVYVIGIGIKGTPKEELKEKCWMYFPEDNCPFYRVTLFSKYSPNHVPGEGMFSLMCEVSESEFKRVNKTELENDIKKGLLATNLISLKDEIVSTWIHREEYGYPTPSVERDDILKNVQPILLSRNILSRGRFGGWKYEVSNQDHSFMQGVEAADFIINGRKEMTYFHPEIVNKK